MRAFFSTLLLSPLFLLPGWAYLRNDRLAWAASVYAIGLGVVILFSTTRFIVEPRLFGYMNLALLALVFATSLHGMTLSTNLQNVKRRSVLLKTAALIGGFMLLITALHTHKSRLFGFDLYHVPSQSMAPTLVPGDIILVDTWQSPSALKPNQIVVFRRAKQSIVLVKRLSELRTTNAGLEMFMLGDNRAYSTDSRRFGWVSTEHVIGVNTGVVTNIK